MAIGITIGLGICALIFVLYPLYARRKEAGPGFSGPASQAHETTEPSEREAAARSALQEVELDYQLGNIADGDYQTLRERYMRRALVALKFRYDREQELDELIEEQLGQMKEAYREGYEKHE